MKNTMVMVLAAFITIAFSCGAVAQDQQPLSPEEVVKMLERGLLDDMAGVGDANERLEKHILMPVDGGGNQQDGFEIYQMIIFLTTMFEGERTTVAAEVPGQATVKTVIQPIEYVFKLDDGVWKLDIGATAERLPEKLRAIMQAMEQREQKRAQLTSCQSNLKELANAALMYAQDWERFPDAEQWMEQLSPYIGGNDALRHCPAAEGMKYGYAMNENVSGLALAEAEIHNPSAVVLFFETHIDEHNAHGNAGDIADPARHENDLNNFAFCDSHVMTVRRGTIPAFEVGRGGAAGVQKNDEPMPKELSPVTQLTDETFTEEVLEQPGWVIVDFGAEQCAPCRRLKPVFGQLAKLYEERVKFASIDVIQNANWSNKLGVGPLPTLILFENGKQIDRIEGFGGADELKAWVQHHTGEK